MPTGPGPAGIWAQHQVLFERKGIIYHMNYWMDYSFSVGPMNWTVKVSLFSIIHSDYQLQWTINIDMQYL